MPRLADPRFAPDCTIEVDGRPVAARAGESIAAALVAAGRVVIARSAKYHRPRGAFCLAGSCHACLARVDGVPNQRTCRIACRPGLSVEAQNAFPTAAHDMLGVIDRVYARGLDHHHLMTWNAVANRAAVALSRRLAGTGTLPDGRPPPAPAAVEERFDAVVVGAGPAGLGAAQALACAGSRVLLADQDRSLGGRLCAALAAGGPSLESVGEVARAIAAAGGEASPGATVAGIWREGGTLLLVVSTGESTPALRLLRARSIIVATGTYALPPAFARNDLPGIFAGRAIARLLSEDGILPGLRCVVAGDAAADLEPIASMLGAAGASVVQVPEVAAAVGRRRLTAVVLPGGERVRCDSLVWCGARAPASDLPRQAGAGLELDDGGGWRLRVREGGATTVTGLRVAGEVVGPMTAAAAWEAGRRAGEAALAE